MATVPVPENVSVLLLDIEGTTTPITFVKVGMMMMMMMMDPFDQTAVSSGTACTWVDWGSLLPAGCFISIHQRELGRVPGCTLGGGWVQTGCTAPEETGHLLHHGLLFTPADLVTYWLICKLTMFHVLLHCTLCINAQSRAIWRYLVGGSCSDMLSLHWNFKDPNVLSFSIYRLSVAAELETIPVRGRVHPGQLGHLSIMERPRRETESRFTPRVASRPNPCVFGCPVGGNQHARKKHTHMHSWGKHTNLIQGRF